MRVLHVHSGNLYGGVETVLSALARFRRLAPSMDMAVALCFEGQIAAELRAAGIEPFMLGDVRLRRPDKVLRARRALRRVLEGGSFDAVVCHQAWTYVVFAPVVKATRAALVLWLHMAQQRHWLDRLAWRVRPDMVLCNSRFTASSVPQNGVRNEIVYAPVEAGDVARDPEIRRSLGTAESDVVIIQASRMEPLKGQLVCLEALAKLGDRGGWTCWQVGGAQRSEERTYLTALQDRARALGIAGRVKFLGHRSDVRELLAAADIFCQPNLQPDAFGVGFVEALSAGVPVVTSAIGGALEIVNDECGVLLEPGSSAALASSLQHLIDNGDVRRRMGDAGRRRAAALCDPGTQMRRLADVLTKLLRPVEVH